MVESKFVLNTIQTSVNFRNFEEYISVSFQPFTIKLSNFTNLKVLSQAVLTDFP